MVHGHSLTGTESKTKNMLYKLQMYEVAHIVSAALNTQLPENLTCIHFGQSTVAKTRPLWIEYYPIRLTTQKRNPDPVSQYYRS